tara:strand:+ start:626 stop:820 length:195 start_codon:yes stop_codon:yes gene_type:complete
LKTSQFIEEVFEIAFGDNAIKRDFSHEEVLDELRKFSNDALKWDDYQYNREEWLVRQDLEEAEN